MIMEVFITMATVWYIFHWKLYMHDVEQQLKLNETKEVELR